jgi:hypothetical protein
VVVGFALAIALVAIDPPIVLLLLLAGYGLSGYLGALRRRMAKRADAAPPEAG